MKYTGALKTAVVAAFFLTPFVSFACQSNADCTSPGQTCLSSGQCGFAAGSSAANCLNTCTGSCSIDASGNATCSTQTGGTSGQCPGGQTYTNGSCVYAPGSGSNPNGTPSPAGGGVPSGVNPSYAISYAGGIIGIINTLLVPILMALAFITFLWGVVNYFFLGADNDTKRAEGRVFVLWGVVGFAIIVSLWGLVYVVTNIFGLPIGGTASTYGIKPPTL